MKGRTVYVISYAHIDYWHALNQPREIAELVREERVPCSIKSAAAAFKEAGWEGNGFIEAFWIPPFMFPYPDTYGVHIWHVKQNTNGTSWLCADRPYDFPALAGSGDNWRAIEVDEGPRNPELYPFSGEIIPAKT